MKILLSGLNFVTNKLQGVKQLFKKSGNSEFLPGCEEEGKALGSERLVSPNVILGE